MPTHKPPNPVHITTTSSKSPVKSKLEPEPYRTVVGYYAPGLRCKITKAANRAFAVGVNLDRIPHGSGCDAMRRCIHLTGSGAPGRAAPLSASVRRPLPD
jgi:hypothetical protein